MPIHQVKDWAGRKTSYSYDQRGLLTQATLPNGTKAQYAYDNAGRMTSLKNVKSDNTVIASYSYTLDKNGNIASEAATQPISRSFKAETVSYTYGSDNRLSSANSTSFTYDDNGNITAKGSNSFQYDHENRLKKVTTSQGTWEYGYDGVGNRIEIKNGSDTRRFLVDPTGMTQAMAEYDGNGNLIAYYIYGLGLIYKVDASGNPYYYHYDFTGNTVAMTDSSGSIVNKYAYTPFGTLVGSKETVSNPFRYVGKYGVMDGDNGLYYMRARYYDSEVGRFITKDPIGFEGGVNLYAYVGNNPAKYIDPNGLCKTEDDLFKEYLRSTPASILIQFLTFGIYSLDHSLDEAIPSEIEGFKWWKTQQSYLDVPIVAFEGGDYPPSRVVPGEIERFKQWKEYQRGEDLPMVPYDRGDYPP